MTGERRQRMLQAGSCLIGLVVAWKYSLALEGTEFSGGRITGPLLTVHFIGSALFILALVLTFIRLRIAAAGVFVASLRCLPVYLYFVAPGFFRWVFPGEYSVPLTSNFKWEGWATAGILVVLLMSYLLKTGMTGTKDRP